MARKPNYDFERREREKAKAAKNAERAAAKGKKSPSDGDRDPASPPGADDRGSQPGQ